MNRRSPGLSVAKAIPGFLQYKAAEGLSPRTLESYKQQLELWQSRAGDCRVDQDTAGDLRAHLVWLRDEYQPKRFGKGMAPLSGKTLRNVWITLSAFFTWASKEFGLPSPMKSVPAPQFEPAPVEPLSKEAVEALLRATDSSRPARTDSRRTFVMRRSSVFRDRALLLILLDTGLRASELCALSIGDVDQKTGKMTVKHGRSGGAKGGKGRVVFLGKAARAAICLH